MPDAPRWVRASVARVYDLRDTTTLLGADGVARQLSGDSAQLARAVLDFLCVAHTRDELLAHLAELAGAPIDDARVIDQLCAVLLRAGAIRDLAAPRANTTPATSATSAPSGAAAGSADAPRPRVVLGVSGAVWAVNVPALVTQLQRRGCEVRVALTPAARRFVAPAALSAITHGAVYTGLFRGDARCPVPHINLAEWADAVLLCPASATTLARIARGDCSELVAALAIATRAPVLVVPSMNPAMYEAAAVQRNLDTLRDDGFALMHPTLGFEVAHRPEERRAVFGPAPAPEEIVPVFLTLLGATPAPAPVPAPAPRSASAAPREVDWDELYRATATESLPWYSPVPDEDTARALERFAPAAGRFLDIGAGTGTMARFAAARGYSVVATDVSTEALARAERLAGDAPVLFVRDDITATDLRGRFDVVHDRGCFHTLPLARRGAYLEAVSRLAAPDACLVVKVHHPDAPPRATHPLTEPELAAFFAPAFEALDTSRTTFVTPDGAQPAVLGVFRRRG